MKVTDCETFWAKIFIAGPIYKAEEVCREWVMKGGCVNITANNYIFTQGEQTGVCIELINYPRFPKEGHEIEQEAIDLGLLLLKKLHQGSFTIMTPLRTTFYDERKPQ